MIRGRARKKHGRTAGINTLRSEVADAIQNAGCTRVTDVDRNQLVAADRVHAPACRSERGRQVTEPEREVEAAPQAHGAPHLEVDGAVQDLVHRRVAENA